MINKIFKKKCRLQGKRYVWLNLELNSGPFGSPIQKIFVEVRALKRSFIAHFKVWGI